MDTAQELHPMVAETFAALDAAGIGWVLLHGERQLAEPERDLDLLVTDQDVGRLGQVLAAIGFAPVMSWGGGGGLSFLRYDQAFDRWLTLDAVTELDFGPHAAFYRNWALPVLRTGAAAGCLDRRRQVGGVWLLDADDGFWTLLLHCLIEKKSVAPRHALRLAELAGDARADGPFGQLITRLCPPGTDASWILERALAADWGSLREVLAGLPAQQSAGGPVSGKLPALVQGLLRLGANARRLPRARGRSVALLGQDGSGKSTLAAGIQASCPLPSRLIYMGLWGRDEPDSAAEMVLAALKRPPRAWLRYGRSQYHRLRGRLVIFDRYPYDAYQPAAPPLVALKKIYFAVLARSCPPPDLVLLIDTPAEVAFARKPEDSLEHLTKLHDAYQGIAARVPHLEIVAGDQPQDQVRADALGRIWRMHLARWVPGRPRRRPAAGGAPVGAGYGSGKGTGTGAGVASGNGADLGSSTGASAAGRSPEKAAELRAEASSGEASSGEASSGEAGAEAGAGEHRRSAP
ncbi:MAG: hypothetical protein ACRDJU_15120 [Actinomycetota bacterium]